MAAVPGVKMYRYYLKHDIIVVDEDDTHEFKGHRIIAAEQMHPRHYNGSHDWRSRKSVSRNISAFLNTGKGGTVYLGILDDGLINGLTLTPYQRDHIRAALWDTLSRYSPPVREHRVKIRFVPVFTREPSETELHKINNAPSSIDRENRCRPHVTRTHLLCWCDKDAIAQANYGVIHPDYVVEIIVKAWDSESRLDGQDVATRTNLHPIHANEEGIVTVRRSASAVQYDLQDVYTSTQHEVEAFYKPQIDELQAKLEQLRATV